MKQKEIKIARQRIWKLYHDLNLTPLFMFFVLIGGCVVAHSEFKEFQKNQCIRQIICQRIVAEREGSRAYSSNRLFAVTSYNDDDNVYGFYDYSAKEKIFFNMKGENWTKKEALTDYGSRILSLASDNNCDKIIALTKIEANYLVCAQKDVEGNFNQIGKVEFR